MASNPPTPTKFSIPQLMGNALGAYVAESAQSGKADMSAEKTKQVLRTAVANASWQFGFLNASVAKFLASAGIKDAVAVQAGYQVAVIYALGLLMPGESAKLGPAVLDGVVSAYVGDQIATAKFMSAL